VEKKPNQITMKDIRQTGFKIGSGPQIGAVEETP
jgi:hypothetical protein